MAKRTPRLTDQDEQRLLSRFAAPLFRSVRTADQTVGAERLLRTLWIALVTGPDMEAWVFQKLEEVGGLGGEDLQAVKERYYNEMKPCLAEEELQALQARYQRTSGARKRGPAEPQEKEGRNE